MFWWLPAAHMTYHSVTLFQSDETVCCCDNSFHGSNKDGLGNYSWAILQTSWICMYTIHQCSTIGMWPLKTVAVESVCHLCHRLFVVRNYFLLKEWQTCLKASVIMACRLITGHNKHWSWAIDREAWSKISTFDAILYWCNSNQTLKSIPQFTSLPLYEYYCVNPTISIL